MNNTDYNSYGITKQFNKFGLNFMLYGKTGV